MVCPSDADECERKTRLGALWTTAGGSLQDHECIAGLKLEWGRKNRGMGYSADPLPKLRIL